ncbi:unnamed protein product [Leptidea sinapis]|uniref:Uncharacterized protein n=1 Tax=Leptidea sinapis TaxID=189913 RepID=A0A5E4PVB8_9NEOP|nr:unnamed protein product [Leptidea sinapis]
MTEDEKYRGLPEHLVPVVEKRFNTVEPFITEDPLQTLVKGYVNNSGEGIPIISVEIKRLDVRNNNPSYVVPREIAEAVSKEKFK